jgi:hypothetical protein
MATTVLSNVRRRPWTANGFGTAFNRAKIAAGMADRDLHFHDLRGTAVTKFYGAGVPERVIAEILAWEEGHVAKIIRRYVDRAAHKNMGRLEATKVVFNANNNQTRISPPSPKWQTRFCSSQLRVFGACRGAGDLSIHRHV